MEQAIQNCVRDLALAIAEQALSGQARLDLDALLKVSMWGRRQTERYFREVMLTSPQRYFRDCQSEMARERLLNGDDVLTASTLAGFSSPGRLHDALVARYGLTPGEVRQKGQGMTIYYGFFSTQLGVVMLGATERGVCFVALCGAEAELSAMERQIEALRGLLPQADLIEKLDAIQQYADHLVDFLERRTPEFCPPLDIVQGTTFQREVWAELRRTQAGEVLSYRELAERLGRPEAVRAVASACARNNVAVAIPCHRVRRADGSLSGYRWGVEWKARLLALEASRHEQT